MVSVRSIRELAFRQIVSLDWKIVTSIVSAPITQFSVKKKVNLYCLKIPILARFIIGIVEDLSDIVDLGHLDNNNGSLTCFTFI